MRCGPLFALLFVSLVAPNEARPVGGGVSVLVTVVDESGRPAAGARITVDSAATWEGGPPLGEGRTGEDGRCAVPLPESTTERVAVRARAADGTAAIARIWVGEDVTLVLQPLRTIRLRAVDDESGRAIDVPRNERTVWLEVRPGVVRATVTAPGFRPAGVATEIAPGKSRRVVVRPTR